MAKSKQRNTKIPAIKQLPSGAYHCKVSMGKDETGKTVYLSITDYDYSTVLLRAAEAKADRKQGRIDKAAGKANLSLGEAMRAYIDLKKAVTSPTTHRGYKTIAQNYLLDLQPLPIDSITAQQIQIGINKLAARLAPKTIRNIHGFLTAVFGVYRPDFNFSTTLPQKVKAEVLIPTEEEILRLFEITAGTDMEIPVMLAACCGMRRSEICALKWSDIDFTRGTITIDQALVLNDEHEFVEKTTKTEAGTRTIRMFPFVAATLERYKESHPDKGGYITIRPDGVSNRFYRIIRKHGFPHYCFHDLRHYTVSVMLSLGIPSNYIAGYVGHDGTRMIETVYGHLLASKKTTVEDQMQAYFSGVFALKGNKNGNTK